jgi:hypothetical protein
MGVTPLPLPPPQVPLMDITGKPTQQGFEFLDRLQSLVKKLNAVTNIFNGLTAAQSTALLDLFTSGAKGLVPASGGDPTKFLRADVTFQVPPLGGMTFVGSVAASSGTTASITNIPVCKALLVAYRNISHNDPGSQSLRFALSTNNGSSYGTPQTMVPIGNSAAVIAAGILTLMRMDQTSGFIFMSTYGTQLVSGVETGTSGTINAIQFSFSAGSFDDAAGFFYAYAVT